MASKWRVLTDPEEITRMVDARLAYFHFGHVGKAVCVLAVPGWAGESQRQSAAACGYLAVLEEDD